MSVSVDTPPLEITERGGEKRKLVLAGRALPLKESGLAFGIKQRVQTTYYGGNPEASQQKFGPTLNDTTISGRWSDRWIGSTTDDGFNVIPEAVAELNGFQIASLADLDALLESMCGSGMELEVKWAHKVRIGTLEEYDPNWRTIHDLEWKMTFVWVSRGEPRTPAVIVTANPADQQAWWSGLKDRLSDAAKPPESLDRITEVVGEIFGDLYTLTATIDDYVLQVQQFAVEVLSPFDVVGAAAASLSSIKDAAQRLLNNLTLQVNVSIAGNVEEVQGVPDTVTTAADGLIAAEWLRGLAKETRAARDAAAEEQDGLAVRLDQRLQDIYVAGEGDDLRNVSRLEYGTADEWQRLKLFNNLADSALSRGQVVLVPQLAALAR